MVPLLKHVARHSVVSEPKFHINLFLSVDDEGKRILLNISGLLPNHTASYARGMFGICVLFNLLCYYFVPGGTPWRSWLRHCATSWKVAGSIPYVVIEIFY